MKKMTVLIIGLIYSIACLASANHDSDYLRTENGSTFPSMEVGPGDTLELTMDKVSGVENSLVSIDVRAKGFQEMAVFEGTIEWNAAGLEFNDVTNFGIDNLSGDNFGRPTNADNQLTYTWTEPTVEGKSVPDSTVIFTLVFRIVGSGGTEEAVTFADSPLDGDAYDNLLEQVAIVENDGLVTIFAPITVGANVQNVSCKDGNDGFVAISAGGGTGTFEYAWSNGETTDSIGGLAEGTYSFTITDANSGLTLIDSIRLVSPEQLVVEIKDVSPDPDSLGVVALTASGGVPPYSYLWNTGDTTDMLTDVENGIYEVTVTDQNGCEVSGTIEVDREMSSGLTEIDQQNWSVHPNPARNSIWVSYDGQEQLIDNRWAIMNSLGQIVQQGRINKGAYANVFSVDISAHLPGIYFMKVDRQTIPILIAK